MHLFINTQTNCYILILSVRLNSHCEFFEVEKFSIFHESSMLVNRVKSQNVALFTTSVPSISIFLNILLQTAPSFKSDWQLYFSHKWQCAQCLLFSTQCDKMTIVINNLNVNLSIHAWIFFLFCCFWQIFVIFGEVYTSQ
jgi:hypothetical protein